MNHRRENKNESNNICREVESGLSPTCGDCETSGRAAASCGEGPGGTGHTSQGGKVEARAAAWGVRPIGKAGINLARRHHTAPNAELVNGKNAIPVS